MWYITWILGLGFAISLGILVILSLESHATFDSANEKATRNP